MSNDRRAWIHLSLFLACMVLSACTDLAANLPLPRTPKTLNQFTPEITVSILPTEAPKGTSTPLPELSKTPAIRQRTNTPTATAETIPIDPPAFTLKETQVASFSASCDDSDERGFKDFPTSLSPNGNWLAISCGSKSNQTLKIYNKTGQKWVLHFKDYVDTQFITDDQTPSGKLYPVRWTSDEKYLYFRSVLGLSGGGACFFGGFGQGLYRMDVDNGTVDATLPPLIGLDLYLFSFSPSGRRLVYNTNSDSSILTILDLQTGEEISLHEENEDIGDFTWSPDGLALAYVTCQPSEDLSTVEKSGVKVFSLETREAKPIMETEDGFLRIHLEADNRLKIYDDFTNETKYFFLGWSTEQFPGTSLTPSP